MPESAKRIIPWVLSLGIVAYLLLTTDLEKVGDALASADWVRLVTLMGAVTITAYLVDSGTLVVLFRRFVAPVTFREVLAIKGVSYFLNAINYSLAAGGMAWFLHKKRDVPFLETFSSLVWFFFVDIIALTLMLTVGYAFGRDVLSDASFVAKIPVLLVVLWSIIAGALVYWTADFDFFVLGAPRKWRVFRAFHHAKLSDYPKMVVVRSAFIMVYLLMHWLLLPAFGVEIGIGHLLMYSPLITFVQVIPASISGLGAVQGVMVALFAAHVPTALGPGRAVIVAYSTVIGPLMTLMRLVIGIIFISNVAKDLVPTKAQVIAAHEAATDE